MNKPQQSPWGDVDAPHLNSFHWLFKILLFFGLTPLMLWLTMTFLMPIAMRFFDKDEAYIAYLKYVEKSELWQAQYVSPEIKFKDKTWLEEAWPYSVSRNAIHGIIDDEDEGFFVSRAEAEASRRRMSGSGGAEDGSNKVVRAIKDKANEWMPDRFYAIQASWVTVFLTRGLYAAQIGVIALFASITAYYFGEYNARVRARRGEQPMGHRYMAWMNTLKYALATIPAYMALPVPAPTLVILVFLFGFVLYCLTRARTHFIEI
jgi:hypothetical protein